MRPDSHPLPVAAVLFDLDGTLADSAGDLAGAVNRIRRERGMAEMSVASLRPHASAGARGLLGAGMGVAPGDPDYPVLRDQFLAYYEAGLAETTALFDGIGALLDALDARGLRWGIVTNKAARYTRPVLAALGIESRAQRNRLAATRRRIRTASGAAAACGNPSRSRFREVRLRWRRPARHRCRQRGGHADDRRGVRLSRRSRMLGRLARERLDRPAARPLALVAAARRLTNAALSLTNGSSASAGARRVREPQLLRRTVARADQAYTLVGDQRLDDRGRDIVRRAERNAVGLRQSVAGLQARASRQSRCPCARPDRRRSATATPATARCRRRHRASSSAFRRTTVPRKPAGGAQVPPARADATGGRVLAFVVDATAPPRAADGALARNK